MTGNLYRSFFWRHVAGIFLLFFLLVSNREAAAQGYKLRYTDTAAGAITFVGNTLGLNTATGAGSVGAFITTNLALNAGGGYPNGTTLNWSNNSSSAVLRMPTNSTVLYAELIWAGTCETVTNAPANSASNVLSYVTNTAVHFFLPNGSSNSVVPDPTTLTIVTNFNGATQQALFYVRSADVTALVQAAGAGTYTVGGVPAEISALDASDDCAGWTLAVAYANSSLHQRNLSIFVGNYWINAASAATSPPVGIAGFCAPPTGAVNGYLFVSAMEGDSQTTGDQMEFGVTTNSFTALSGPNNSVNNFFSSQINYCQPDNLLGTTITNGYLDTSGTFGLSNSIPGSSKASVRQGWDITCVNASAALTNSATSAFAKFVTSGDGYSAAALALQIDVGSPVLTTSQTVDKGSTYVGDTLTYTVVVTNSGTADAVNLIFTDPLPFGTSYITNTFTTNGVAITGANPVNGVAVPIIKQGSSYTATYKVQVNQIPPVAKFVTAATINFQYAGACAQSPIINSTLVNANVQTLVPLLNVNKTTSQTNLVPGTIFTYTINIPNVGTTNTADSALNDQIPAGTTYVPGTTTNNGVHIPDIGSGGTNMPYTVTTEIHGPGRAAGVINVGDTVVVSFKVKISPTFPSFINNTATIYVNTNAPTSSQSAAANIPPIVADLAVGIVGTPTPVAAGTNITYTVTVTNHGPNTISAVTNSITNSITLYLPLSQSVLSPIYTPSSGTYNPLTGVWSGLNLPSNAVVTLTISGMVSPDTTASNIVSSVTVIPPPGIFDPVTNNNSASATNTVVQIADLAVTISDGVTNVHQGDALTYIVTAVNLGPSTLTSLSVSNSLSTNDLVFIPSLFASFTFSPNQGSYNPANGVWSGLELTPGSSATLTLQATVLNNVSGFFTNTVVVSVPSGITDPVLTNNTSSDVDIILTAPDVAVIKAGPTNVFAGTNFSYTITLTNSGFATASNVVASDTLPTNVTFVSASGNGTNNSGVVSWSLGNLAVNATSNLTLTVTAPTSGNITNVATSTASTPDSNPGNNTSPPVGTTVTPVADLAVGKSAPASVIATSNFTYTVSITNLGPSSASSVIATDTLPANVTFVSASGGGVNTGGGVSWALISLNSGQVSNLTVTVTAPANGSITNKATVSSGTLDINATNNTSQSVITTVTPLALSADISVTKTGPTSVFAGTNFSYSITVTNAGVGTASNVVASDVLPTNVVFISASSSGTNNAGTVNWPLGNLILHATTNLTLTVIAPASGTITNVATVASTSADPNPTNNTSPPVTTGVTPVADVVVTNAGPGSVLAGAVYTNTISVTNLGPSVASNVVVMDTEPGGVLVTNVVGTLAPGVGTNFLVVEVAPGSGPLTNSASSTASTGDPNLGNNTNIVAVTAVTPEADVAVGKVGPGSVFAGSNVVYTITVTNLGPSAAGGVVVTDALPVGVTFVNASGLGATNLSGQVIWVVGALGAGAVSNVTLTVIAPASGTITNVASVGWPGGDPVPTNNTSPPVTTGVTPVADVVVTNAGPGSVLAGAVYTNTISVTNLGPSVASNVVVMDTEPGGVLVTNVVGTLAPGVGTNFLVVEVAPGSGPLTNSASSTASTGDPNLGNNTNIVAVTAVTPEADVAVGKVGPGSVFAGSNVVYTITVTNLGPSAAGGVVVTDALPVGVTFVNASGLGATNLSGQVIWVVGALGAGAVSNVTLTVIAPASGTITNVASVGWPGGDPVPTNNTSPPVTTGVTPVADVVVTNAGPGSVLAGAVYTNTISVTNLGPSVASNVVVMDTEPGGVLVTNVVGTLAPGVGTNFLVVEVAPGSGPLTNSASSTASTGDPNLGNNTNIVAVTAVTPEADVAVGKVGPGSVFAGSNVVYTITVTNLGPSAAGGVVVTDALPVGVTFVNASGLGATNLSGQVIWVVGALGAGAVSNVTLTVIAPASGTITNVASVGWPGGDPVPTNNTSPPVTTGVTPVADVVVTNAGPGSVLAGAVYTNTISVTNLGPSVASNVVVMDTEPGGVLVTNVVGTLAPGVGTNFLVVEVAPGSGPLTNSASSTASTGDPNLGNNTNIVAVTAVTPEADVAVGKVGPGSVFAGSNVVYTITVTNLGPSAAGGVVVTDALPVGVTFVNASGLGATNLSGQVIWVVGALGAGAVSNVTLTVIAPASGTITNVASVGWPGGDPVPTNNTSPPVTTGVTPVADVVVTNAGPGSVLAGAVYTNTISVTNLGPSVASNVVVMDTEPGGVLVTNVVGTLAPGVGTNFLVVEVAPGSGPLTNSASSTASTGDPNLGNNTNIVAVTAVTPEADVAVGKVGPGSVFAGSNVVYTITVTNLGPSAAGGVVVTDALPVGVTFVNASGLGATNLSGQVIWVVGALGAGAVSNVTLTVIAPASGTITNVASVGWPGGDPVPTNNTSPPVTTGVTPVADVVVTNAGPGSVLAGAVYTNTISVTNLGPSVASNVVVMDTEPGGVLVTNVVGTLAPGVGTNFLVVEVAPGSGPLTNSASSTASTGDPNLGNNTNIVAVTAVTPEADVAVGKVGPGSVFAGSNVVYTITVTNLGPSAAGGVVVTDALPVGVTFVNASGLGATNLSGQVIWVVGALGAGAVSNVTLTVIAPASGTITNVASVGWPGGDPVPTNNTSPPVTTGVTPVADVVVTNAGPGSVLAGAVYTNTISVTNLGPSVASNVVVMDTEPGGVLVTNVVGTLAPGVGTNFLVVEVAPGSGPLTNSASSTASTGDPNLGNNTNIVAVTAVTPEADVAVGKVGPGSVFAGSNVVYTITVTNLGPSAAGGVVVTDALPVGVTFVNASGLGATNLSGQVIWVVGALGAGAVSNVTLTVIAPASGTITNVASVGWPGGDPVPTNNTSPPVTTGVTPVADVVVTNAGPGSVLAGAVYTNTISVTNLGPSVASNVVVMDTEPGGVLVTNVVGTLAPGVGTNFLVVEVAPGSGPLTNSASSTASTGDPNLGNNTNIVAVTAVTPEADVAVGKVGPGSVFAGSNVVYTITVTNLGPSAAGGVVVTDALPVGVTFVNASGLGATNLSGQVIWVVGALGAGAVSNVTLTVIAPASGTITNVASVGWPGGDPVPTNNTSPPVTTGVTPVADVVVTNAGPGSVLAGAVYTNTISVTNLGPSVASNVVVMDTEPGGVLVTNVVGTLAPGVGTNFLVVEVAPGSGPLTNSASSTASTGDPNLGNNTNIVAVTAVTPEADVAVGKVGPGSVFAGSNVVYTITVTNLGPSAAGGVVVTDALPVGVTFVNASGLGATNLSGQVIWVVGALGAGAVSNVTLTVIAPASGTITNVASVGWPGGDPVPTNNTSPPVTTGVTPVADVVVTNAGPGSVLAGAVYTNTISVTNLGPSVASNVVVMDTEPGGVLVTNVVGTLAPGVGTNFLVVEVAPGSGPLTNSASSTASTGDPNLGNNTNIVAVTAVTPEADVAVGKVGPGSVFAGSNVVYTITVTNLGPSAAGGVVVTDALPVGVTFVNASGLGATNLSGQVIWVVGALGAGAVSNVTLTVIAPASGTITNVASVGWPGGDPVPTNNTSPPVTTGVTPVADVVVTNAGPGSVLAGAVYTNTISVTNLGPSVASNVVVMDTEPGGVLVTNVVGTLAPGVGTNFLVVEVAPGSGPLTNSASSTASTGDPNLGNNTNIVAVTAVTPEADVAVGKVGPGSVFAGSNVVYTITVTNLGPSAAGGVVVTDALPVGVTFVNASGLGATNLSGQVIWVVGALGAGAVSNVTLTVIAPASGTITNVASVGWPGGDPVPTNNTSPPVTTGVTPVADVVVTNAGPGSVLAGAVYTNTISVTNLGPSVASNVVVMDTEPGGVLVTNVVGTLAPGVGTNFLVVEVAPGSGPLTNSASSTASTGDPNLGNNTNIVAVTAVTPEADVAVGKVGPGSVFAGSNVVYTITVTNLGPSAAGGVVVTDALPVGVTFVNASGLGATNLSGQVIWVVGALGAGAVSNVTLTVIAPASGTITNVASVGWPGGDPVPTNNTSPPVTTGVTPVADVVVTNAGPGSVLAGAVYTNTISVTNLGPSVASNVVVMDTEPGGVLVTNVVGTLAPGVGTNFLVVEVAPGSGPLTNSASSTASTGDPNLGNNTNIVAVTAVTPEADVAVGKVGPGSVFAGSNVVYTITVTNLGPSAAGGVVVTDALPVGVTFVNASGLGATNLSGQVIWVVGALGAGAVSNVTLTVIAPASGTITNVASVGWPGGDPVPTNNTSPPVTTGVVVASNIPPVAVNDSYTVVENTPSTVPADGVLTNDTDAGGNPLTAVLVTGPIHGTVTLNTNGGFTYTPATNFTGMDSFTYVANDGQTNSGVATVTLTILPAADVVVLKTGPVSGVAGSNLVYTITVTNHGPATATNVLVSDQLPVGLTLVSATPATALVSTNNLVTWPVFNQAKNAKNTFTVTVLSPDGGTFTNVAFSTTTTFDPNPTNSNGTATNSQVVTAVTPRADLAVFKTGNTSVAANGAVNYTITVTNIGPSTATNVVVTDTLPLAVAFQSASGSYNLSGNVLTWPVIILAKGATTNFTVSVTAPANGSFTNIASAGSDTPDPNPTNNNGTASSSKVTTTVVPAADVSITMTGPPTVTVGDGFSYTLVVSNGGPSIAVNTLVTNVLPTNLVFASVSGGGTNKNGVVTWPVFPTLTNGQSTNLILTVTPLAGASTIATNASDSFNFVESNTTPTIGFLTNSASAFAATFDPNLTNNSASTAYTNAEVQTVIVPGVFSVFIATNTYPTNGIQGTITNTIIPIGNNLFIVGTSAWNPETQLYEEDVSVTNLGPTSVSSLRVYVGHLRKGVTLYNATGSNSLGQYVEYDPPAPLMNVPPDNFVTFQLEFYVADGQPFTNSLTAVAALLTPPPIVGNQSVTNLQINIPDTRDPGNRYLIQFATIPGRTYTIEYSDVFPPVWKIAIPSIIASSTSTLWYDDGPPETSTPSTGSRYYQVFLDP